MKSRNILILALVMALVTTFLFNKYLKNLEMSYKKSENKVSIAVPKEDIKENQKVTADMLEIEEISQDAVLPGVVKNIQDIEGKYALTDMKKGEMLFADRFTDQFQETRLVTRKIRDGYRAVSIEVNFVQSVSNLIEPEDYVDVIFSEKTKTTADNVNVNTVMLLQNVRVLAVGMRLTQDNVQNNPSNGKNSNDAALYTSVTLELKPDDVVKLENAEERGDVSFALRSSIFP